jgi:hypothetical protein
VFDVESKTASRYDILEFAQPGQNTPKFLQGSKNNEIETNVHSTLHFVEMFSWACPESHNPHIATLQWYYLYAGCTMIMFGQSHTLSWWRHTRLSLALLVPPWNILKAGRSIHKRSCSIFLLDQHGPTWTNKARQCHPLPSRRPCAGWVSTPANPGARNDQINQINAVLSGQKYQGTSGKK